MLPSKVVLTSDGDLLLSMCGRTKSEFGYELHSLELLLVLRETSLITWILITLTLKLSNILSQKRNFGYKSLTYTVLVVGTWQAKYYYRVPGKGWHFPSIKHSHYKSLDYLPVKIFTAQIPTDKLKNYREGENFNEPFIRNVGTKILVYVEYKTLSLKNDFQLHPDEKKTRNPGRNDDTTFEFASEVHHPSNNQSQKTHDKR